MIKSDVVYIYGAGTATPPVPWEIFDTYRTCRIYYIHKGHAYFYNSNAEFELKPEHLYYFPPNLPFVCKNSDTDPILHTFFDFIMLSPIISESYIEIDVRKHSELKWLILAADEIIKKQIFFYLDREENHKIIFDYIELIIKTIDSIESLNSINDEMILKSLEIIHRKYRDRISVSDIAEQLNFNVDYFIRRFKKYMNVTPYSYIKSLKTIEACHMKLSGYNNKEIASKLGYSDSSALCHALKPNGSMM